ncbi:transcriptional regulatory protein [Bordetella ansorpii]|uniref:Transcriptional regulatory protein n=2 Tax=Bordetella ansorpii TaxID=288768 RepID=A0A157SWM2_9BORD|nr:sigma-54 dependent transcriptional regulator [Bordetella ansorpii]SAI74872.1 transcriptional regulatory protein [Bordetella ansorpii]
MLKDTPPRQDTATDAIALGRSPAMRDLQALVTRAAPTDASVFLVGESGTGKDMIAQRIHAASDRREGPYIALNCGAVSSSLAHAELFGHEKGSFTGALARTPGYFEHASGGTLFLDELTEMPIDMQAHFLRVLETGTYRRVGGTDVLRTNVRIISATNRDPQEAVAQGRLREDLLHRLLVIPMRVPPLRERREDIAYLAQQMLDDLNRRYDSNKKLGKRLLESMDAYDWPGNVRELRNVVQRAYLMCDDVLHYELVPSVRAPALDPGSDSLAFAVGTPLNEAQRELIRATLNLHHGDKRRAAATLGISLKTLYNRLNAYGLDAQGAA